MRYHVYSDYGLGGSFTKLASTTLNYWLLNNLTNGENYKFYITAENVYGEGPGGDTITMRIASVPYTPAGI